MWHLSDRLCPCLTDPSAGKEPGCGVGVHSSSRWTETWLQLGCGAVRLLCSLCWRWDKNVLLASLTTVIIVVITYRIDPGVMIRLEDLAKPNFSNANELQQQIWLTKKQKQTNVFWTEPVILWLLLYYTSMCISTNAVFVFCTFPFCYNVIQEVC